MWIVVFLALVAGAAASAGLWVREVWRAVPGHNQDFDFAGGLT